MSIKAQLAILKLCEGLTIAQAQHRLDIMEQYIAQRQLELRVRLA